VSGPPTPWLRRAGRIDLGGGETVLWSVAEGRRGRRWRSMRKDSAGHLISDLLLEVDPRGRWTRLELAAAAGILTLHPDPDDAAAHGNVITELGVVPLAFAWSPRHRLVVPGEPAAGAALGVADATPRAPGPGLVVGLDLAVTVADAIEPMAAPPGGLPGAVMAAGVGAGLMP
jgi:hypothetical protein